MHIGILQLKKNLHPDYQFRSYDYAKNHGFQIKDYDLIYSCERNIKNLDQIFEEFNINMPDDFKGHSLSVSDIILVNNDFFYIDNFGFEHIK